MSKVTNWITAVAAIFAVVFATIAWLRSRQALKQQIVNELFNEYGTKEMHDAVASLHHAFRNSTKCRDVEKATWGEKRKWIDCYKKEYRKDREKKLHLQRRKVSSFYQKIAYFSRKNPYVSRIVKEMWGQKNTAMVMQIILPIETVALPELLQGKKIEDEPKPDEYNYAMWLLQDFWRRGPGILTWRLRIYLSRRFRYLWDFLTEDLKA